MNKRYSQYNEIENQYLERVDAWNEYSRIIDDGLVYEKWDRLKELSEILKKIDEIMIKYFGLRTYQKLVFAKEIQK